MNAEAPCTLPFHATVATVPKDTDLVGSVRVRTTALRRKPELETFPRRHLAWLALSRCTWHHEKQHEKDVTAPEVSLPSALSG